MKELTKLVRIVTKRHQRNNPLLNFNDKRKNKELQLFQEIQNGTSAKTSGQTENSEGRMVRARLRKKLLNHLFFLDFSDTYIKVSHRYEQNCLDLLHQARILIKESEYQISEKLLRSALKIALEAEFTSLILIAIELLRGIYVQTTNILQFQKVSSSLEYYRQLATQEQIAESLYYTARLEMSRSVNAKKTFLPELEEIVLQLKGLWEENKSFYLFELYYKTYIWYQELTNNFNNIIQLTSETEQGLEEGTINNKRFDDRYNKYVKVYAHLRARHIMQGLDAAEKYAESFNRASNNWFAFMENYFLLAMHARRYEIANRIIKEIHTNPFLPKITKIARERWELYRSYLYFINPNQDLLRQFNYQTFMSATPEYSKDKQGFNVAILILQFLYFLKAKEVEALLYRIENLKKYSGRHFKDNFSIRSQLFFKLLMLVVREDLKPDACRRKGRALADKLAETPAPGDAYAEIEIIPYEQLWELILEMLQKLQTVNRA